MCYGGKFIKVAGQGIIIIHTVIDEQCWLEMCTPMSFTTPHDKKDKSLTPVQTLKKIISTQFMTENSQADINDYNNISLFVDGDNLQSEINDN